MSEAHDIAALLREAANELRLQQTYSAAAWDALNGWADRMEAHARELEAGKWVRIPDEEGPMTEAPPSRVGVLLRLAAQRASRPVTTPDAWLARDLAALAASFDQPGELHYNRSTGLMEALERVGFVWQVRDGHVQWGGVEGIGHRTERPAFCIPAVPIEEEHGA